MKANVYQFESEKIKTIKNIGVGISTYNTGNKTKIVCSDLSTYLLNLPRHLCVQSMLVGCMLNSTGMSTTKFITNIPDLKYIWVALENENRYAFFPKNRQKGFETTKNKTEYMRKKGVMLTRSKLVRKFGLNDNCFLPQIDCFDISIESDIIEVYNDKEHISSCMSDHSQLTEFYEKQGCNILVARLCDTSRVIGRAIIWNECDTRIVDRIYSDRGEVNRAMNEYSIRNGFEFRADSEAYYGKLNSGKHFEFYANRDFDVPWLDTFKFGRTDCNGRVIVSNNPDSHYDFELQDSDGWSIDDNQGYCYRCGNSIDINNGDYYIVNYDHYCVDCATYSDYYDEDIELDGAAWCEDVNSYVNQDDENFVYVNNELRHTESVTFCEECSEYFNNDEVNYDEETGCSYCDECHAELIAEREKEEELETVNN